MGWDVAHRVRIFAPVPASAAINRKGIRLLFCGASFFIETSSNFMRHS